MNLKAIKNFYKIYLFFLSVFSLHSLNIKVNILYIFNATFKIFGK